MPQAAVDTTAWELTTVSGYWFLVTVSVLAPDLPDYPDLPEYRKKSGISGAKEAIRRNSGFCILTQSIPQP
jgi:hypothetical protein